MGEVALPERLLKLLKSVVRVMDGTREWLVALDSCDEVRARRLVPGEPEADVGDMAWDRKPKGEGAAERLSFGGAGAANSGGGSGDAIGEMIDETAGVALVVVELVLLLVAAVAPAGAALMLRWTVSPSLMPSYSFSSRSSAIALPLYNQRCLSGSGAPLTASWACSCALSDATSAVGEQASVNVKGGLRDLTVMLMVAAADESVAVSPPAAAPALVLLVPASLLLEMGSGGWTTGICRHTTS